MLPEVASLLGRARTGRFLLEELLGVLAEADHDRRAAEGEWSVREVIAHVASADYAVVALLDSGRRDVADVLVERDRHWRQLCERDATEVIVAARDGRSVADAALAALDHDALGSTVWLAPTDAWGTRRPIDLRSYLASWATHDAVHVEQVRDALSSTLSPSVLAATASRAR